MQAGFLTSPGKFKHSTAGEAPSSLELSERTGESRIQSSALSPFQEADRHKSQGYIHSKSIIKLVLALKAKAIPLRSLTRPTNVLWMRGKMQVKRKDASLHVLYITITLQASCIGWPNKEHPPPPFQRMPSSGTVEGASRTAVCAGWRSLLPDIQAAPALRDFRKTIETEPFSRSCNLGHFKTVFTGFGMVF